jgi:formylglycine-generating enzyme required for sulfatase activity
MQAMYVPLRPREAILNMQTPFRPLLAAAVVAFAVTASGCFNPQFQPELACDLTEPRCPPGYECGPDDICRAEGSNLPIDAAANGNGNGLGADASATPDANGGTGNGADASVDPDGEVEDSLIDWVALLAGTFSMGSDENDAFANEQPVHEVTLSAFELARTETTVAQYAACVEAGVCAEPARDYTDGLSFNWGAPGRDEHPINGVTWFQAEGFCEYVGGRLPTEAEREYAARSEGQDQKYPWGDEEATCERAVMNEDGEDGCGDRRTSPVCSKPAGHSAQGICNLAGNVSEWVYDWFDDYPSEPQVDPTGPESGSNRVLRGGNWLIDARLLRASFRSSVDPSAANINFGFRCARSPDLLFP